MIRKIIRIVEAMCNGCGACAAACHEGAIAMVDGKARLMRDDYCDGLGDCLPACPTGAISFEEREAADYDAAAVLARGAKAEEPLPCGCPGTHVRSVARSKEQPGKAAQAAASPSRLSNWPVQLRLVPESAPYLDGAKLLVAADCTAFARGDFHQRFLKDRIALVGCPKLDDADYAGKLTEILKNCDIRSLTVVRMEVPCCGGLENAVRTALKESGKLIPWQVVILSTEGEILD